MRNTKVRLQSSPRRPLDLNAQLRAPRSWRRRWDTPMSAQSTCSSRFSMIQTVFQDRCSITKVEANRSDRRSRQSWRVERIGRRRGGLSFRPDAVDSPLSEVSFQAAALRLGGRIYGVALLCKLYLVAVLDVSPGIRGKKVARLYRVGARIRVLQCDQGAHVFRRHPIRKHRAALGLGAVVPAPGQLVNGRG